MRSRVREHRCVVRSGLVGPRPAYIIRVHGGGCSAYQSFVNFDGPPSGAVVGVKKTKWPAWCGAGVGFAGRAHLQEPCGLQGLVEFEVFGGSE